MLQAHVTKIQGYFLRASVIPIHVEGLVAKASLATDP